MRLENLTEGNGSYPTQTSDPTRRCGVAPQQGLTAPTPRHRDLRPVHKGEEIVAQGRPGPSYLPPTANHRHASQPPPERAQRARAEPEEKKGSAYERSEPRPCERPTRKLFFPQGEALGEGKFNKAGARKNSDFSDNRRYLRN